MKLWHYCIGVALWLTVCAAPVFAQTTNTPLISSVEPPSWWAGHSLNPVRVLMHGARLSGARVRASGAGLTVSQVRVNAAGSYLFADIAIAKTATPGRRTLQITTPQGKANAAFDLLPPLTSARKSAGLTPDDVIYLIMPDRFSDGDSDNNNPAQSPGLYDPRQPHFYHGGDLQGILNRLPYLKGLGVTALWLTPIYDNADKLDAKGWTSYHGYGAINYYGVEEHFGTLATLQKLTLEAHKLGLKVVQDQVANHVGPAHPWVADLPTPTWLHGTIKSHSANLWQTWELMSSHATPQTRQRALDGWFADLLPDLNQNDPQEARYTIQNTLWWLGIAGFDGIRQDTLSYVPRTFWHDWTSAIKREYPQMLVIGEVNAEDPALTSFFQGGKTQYDGIDTGVTTLFDYPLYGAIRETFAGGKSMALISNALAHDYLYPHPELLVPFVDLHDVPRFLSLPGATPDGYQLALTFLMTTRGLPLLYYGDEIGMEGGSDPDNRRDFPGGFPGAAHNAFSPTGRTPQETVYFQTVRRLLKLRQDSPALRRGTLRDLLVTDQQYVYARVTPTETAIIALNNDTKPVPIRFSVSVLNLSNGTALSDKLGNSPAQVKDGEIALILPPRGAAVWTVSRSRPPAPNSGGAGTHPRPSRKEGTRTRPVPSASPRIGGRGASAPPKKSGKIIYRRP